ncbi:MAG TPA: hypothetical protein VM052_04735 [Candidatus Limnocylindrales bacterium]|nr:hypothetical protein [Candidatus Limnocylindrales bacterium]
MAALSALTLGAYVPIWFGLTWAELKRETKDETKMPLGHALLILAPGVNINVVWRHFRAINALLERDRAAALLDPLSGAIGIIIWWLTFTHYSSEPLFLVLDAVEMVAGTAVVVYGQHALNRYWSARGAEERVLQTDVLALAAAASYALFTVVGFLAPS